MTTAVSKSAQVVKYFAQQSRTSRGKGILRKRLVKMAYLVDMIAREYLGEPITTLGYYRYKFGPYDKAIKGLVDELVAADLAIEKNEWMDDYSHKLLIDRGVSIEFDFTLAESEILRYVAANYLNMPMEELLQDVVYPSAPMKLAQAMHEVLPMHVMNNQGKKIVGFDLAEILKAEQEIDAGNFATQF